MYTGAGENESKTPGASHPTYPKARKTIMKNLAITSGRSSFAFRMLSISVVAGLLSGLWINSAGATDTRRTITDNGDGSVTVCTYKTDFVTTKDGANMIRKAWRCETTRKPGR